METRNCQNCKQDFTIEPEDFNFYSKIKVPPPTFCPECRFIRRYLWRNERVLYKRKSSVPNIDQEIISMYAPEKDLFVYDEKYWWSDAWSPLDYGQDYDFTKNFFEQYSDLLKRVPLISLSVTNNTISSYCNVSAEDKGSYMLTASGLNENCLYGNRIANTKDSADVYISDKNQLCYEVVDSNNCYNVSYSVKANNCVDSKFLYDCVNCQNCVGCVGLRNKNYHIFNDPFTKEDYFKKLEELNLHSYQNILNFSKSFVDFRRSFPNRYADNINCVNVTGDNVRNSKNAKFCFDVTGVENCKFMTWIYMGIKDSYDIGAGSGVGGELLYDTWDTNFGSSNVFFSGVIYSCFNVQYSWNCHGSNNLFGCYGLRNKEYCILNKQYTKEEYNILLPKIISHMNEMPYLGQGGRVYTYGEYFPIEISPFSYNETIAQEYFPLNKESALSKNYLWHEKVEKNYNISLRSVDLPDNILDINDSILSEIISCQHDEDNNHQFSCESSCTKAFKITRSEFDFYKRINIPIPHLCPNCRHYRRLKERNPIKLWHRACMCEKVGHAHGDTKCEVKFETSYAPNMPELIYCEKCYQAEVY